MKETIDFHKAKEIMSNINIIIYGTIRNIEEDFIQSFTNLDILASFFKKTHIIIFENDSKDKTRDVLNSWYQNKKKQNISKHIILENNLCSQYPLRATRLAYCRNQILDYIFDNHLEEEYSYAFHCDLDNRFWSINFDSICNSFQYPLESWDVMTCVNKNKKYYDYWALRVDNCWFNKNIFSCDANWPETNFETKTHEFIKLLNKTTNLLLCNSSFNGLGIYKLSSMKNCRYSANYYCSKCKNTKNSCLEDNDHIGLHRAMKKNNCKIFINTKMQILSKPKTATSFHEYIKKNFLLIKNLNNNPLLYVLKNNLVNKNNIWIDFDMNNGEPANIISSYHSDSPVYSFHFNKKKFTFLNKNIVPINGPLDIALNIFIEKYLNNDMIYLMNFNDNNYFNTKKILENLISKIADSCIIVFNHFINFHGYIQKSFKAFFEITQEYNIDFETIGVNGNYDFISNNSIDFNDLSDDLFSDTIVAIQIVKNPNKNNIPILVSKSDSSIYTNDLALPKQKNQDINYDIFDWMLYVELNPDLVKINNAEKGWKHWYNHGYLENRNIYFDLQKCLEEHQLPKNMNRVEVIQKFKKENNDDYKNYCKKFKFNQQKNNKIIKKYKTELFNWEYYLEINKDLKNINSFEKALEHFHKCGEKEGRITSDFNWLHYLILNQDLIENNIIEEESVVQHYLNYGINEKRIYTIK